MKAMAENKIDMARTMELNIDSERLKTIGKKEKMLVTSIFFFWLNDSKKVLPQGS